MNNSVSFTHTYVCVTTNIISLTFDSLIAHGTASCSCNHTFKTCWTESYHFSRHKHSEKWQVLPCAFSWIKMKTQLISNPPRNEAFWNLDQILLAVSYISNILHSSHYSIHTCQHPDQTLSWRPSLFWILLMDALLLECQIHAHWLVTMPVLSLIQDGGSTQGPSLLCLILLWLAMCYARDLMNSHLANAGLNALLNPLSTTETEMQWVLSEP